MSNPINESELLRLSLGGGWLDCLVLGAGSGRVAASVCGVTAGCTLPVVSPVCVGLRFTIEFTTPPAVPFDWK